MVSSHRDSEQIEHDSYPNMTFRCTPELNCEPGMPRHTPTLFFFSSVFVRVCESISVNALLGV